MVELGEDGAHAVVAQAAGVVGGGDEAAAKGIHPGQGGDPAGVAEIVGVLAPGEGGAGGWFHRHDAGIPYPPQLVGHKGGDQPAQVGAAAGAAHHHVGIFPQLLHGQLALQADDGLVEEHLVEHAAQHIALGAAALDGGLHRLGDGAAQASCSLRVVAQGLAAHLSRGGGRGGDRGVEYIHHRLSEGLLLVGALDHKHVAGQAEVTARLTEGGAPLAGAGLSGDAG